jgi:hypothetical protein
MTGPQGAPLELIAARPLGSRPGHVVLLKPVEIAFAFVGSAAPPEMLALCARSRWRLDARRVYARTARGVFQTPYRCIAELQRDLDTLPGRPFVPSGRGRIVNVLRVASLDTEGRAPLAQFVAADGTREAIPISRRCWPPLRERFGLRRRR